MRNVGRGMESVSCLTFPAQHLADDFQHHLIVNDRPQY
jgi:hypothetical protein